MHPSEERRYFVLKDVRRPRRGKYATPGEYVIRSRLLLDKARRCASRLNLATSRVYGHRMANPAFWLQLHVTHEHAAKVDGRTYGALIGTKDPIAALAAKARFVEFCRTTRHADWRRAWPDFEQWIATSSASASLPPSGAITSTTPPCSGKPSATSDT